MNSLRQQALKRLARREHSRFELEQKLSALGTTEEIAAVLDHLEQTGLLSDQRTASAYLSSQAARFGTAKLKHTLRAKGIADELIAASLAEAARSETLASEEVRALAIWRRKYGQLPVDAREWARQARFLQSRGFSIETIKKTLKASIDDPA